MQKIKGHKRFILIGFIMGALIFGTTGVLALTYYASKDVSYDNRESGMTSENVQDAIDELYQLANAIDVNGAKIPVVTSGNGLYEDTYEEGRYIYKGANPNNYITFSGETWRIISVESDNTIKIMRNESIGNMVWDETDSNNWARPATLNTYLNDTYLPTLSDSDKVVSHNYSIGVVTYDNNDLADQINDEKGTTWNGKVGLITASEYLRANTNTAQCETNMLNNDNRETCLTTNWMYSVVPSGDDMWTISPDASYADDVFFVFNIGALSSHNANFRFFDVVPVLYLSSEISITGGSGTSSDPYTLGQ